VNSGWALAVFNAAVAAVLINAAVTKIIAPGPLLRASAEVLAAPRWLRKPLVRGFGGIELAVAVALLILSARLLAAIATTVLGVCFALAGIAGVLHGSNVPCGCFGGASRQPLGGANVALGAALALVWPVNLLVGQGPAPGYSAAAVLLASIAAAVLCLWLNRRLIKRVLPISRTRSLGVS
jgi:Methylamine utilisation protein MauE